MKNLGNLQKTASIAAATLLLHLCGTTNAGAASRFTLARKDTGKSATILTGTRLEINRKAGCSSSKKISVIQSALTPTLVGIDSVIADRRTCLTRPFGEEALSKKWDRSDEFKLKFSVDRYWADQFHNEFRRSWIDSERKRAPSLLDIYGR